MLGTAGATSRDGDRSSSTAGPSALKRWILAQVQTAVQTDHEVGADDRRRHEEAHTYENAVEQPSQ